MYTEEQAHDRWCPLAWHEGNTDCIASKCMWWRWVENSSFREGYCGVAGRPGLSDADT